MLNPWQKTKRNHGLEHATIALLLSDVHGARPMAGYSIATGFLVVGHLTTEQVEASANDALRRMQTGEGGLAVSPFCGTNIVVGAGLASAASLAGYHMAGQGFRGMARAFSNATLAIVASRPIGRMVQQHVTTSADVGRMSITSVTRHQIGSVPVYWVATSFAH